MKIKSLLLGSAAALATTATSQAADAIVIEPEPMEYVSVCDMYGTGYFYIPGTDTCLKLGGYVQLDYYTKSYHEDEDISDHRVRSRARLQVAAKNETSYGTLNSQIWWYSQLYDSSDPHDQFSTPDGFDDDGVGVWLATMSLAGFRAGYDATNYTIWNTYGGKGFYTAVQEGGYTEASGFLFEYNGSFGDINYGIGVVDTTQSGAAGQPDVMAGFRTSFGILGLHASAAYDSNSEGVAYRLRGDLDLGKFLPGAAIGAWWEGDNGETDYRKGHQWGVTAKVNLIDKIQLYAGYSDYDYDCDLDSWENAAWGDEDNSPPYPGNSISTTGQCAAYNGMLGSDGEDANYGSDQWTVGVRWDVTPNLYTQLEYNKTQSVSWDSTDQVVEETDTGTTWLRIRRSF